MAKKPNGLQEFRRAFKQIKNGQNLKPVYYLYGEESFFSDLIQDEVEKIIPPDQKDFNFDLIYGAESSPEQVLGIARSFPMMFEKRVVIVKDFLRLEDNSEDGTLQDFVAYIKQPNPTTLLCLIDKKIPDGRTALGKQLRGSSDIHESFEFSPLFENQLPDWIMDWANHAHNRKFDPKAALTLSQLAGYDLQILSTEIEKLCTFVDTQEIISEEHVKKISGLYRDYTVFELKDAVIERNLDKAFGIAEQILQRTNNNAGEVFKTVGFFYNVFGNVWQICRYREKGLDKNQIQKKLEINNYIFNAQWNEASRFRLSEMPQIFEALLDADRALKGFSTLDTPSIFLLLLKRIIG